MKTEFTHFCTQTSKVLSAIFVFSFLIACSEQQDVVEEASPAQSMAKFCDTLPREQYADLRRIDYDSDWFELYNVAPGVTAIYEPHQWQEVISYLIEGEQKALLFDTGNGIDDIQRVATFLTSKPIEVLNSHSHYDHVGGNYQFETVYGLDTPFTRLRQQGRTPKQIGIEVSEAALCKPAPHNKTPENHVGEAYQISQFLGDSDTLDLGGRMLKIIHVPGHTPDAIALLDEQNGLMWTGDSFYAGPIWLYSDETDLAAYRQSLDKMIEQIPNLNALLPAHNTPWVEPEVLVSVKTAFDDMLAGKLKSENQGDGMVEYFPGDDAEFSFLMRDEPLPYVRN